MDEVQVSRHLVVSPGAAFAAVSDPRKPFLTESRFMKMRVISEETRGPGTRYRWEFRLPFVRPFGFDEEVTRWDEGHACAYRALTWWKMDAETVVEPELEGSRITYTMRYQLPRPWRRLVPRWFVRLGCQGALRSLGQSARRQDGLTEEEFAYYSLNRRVWRIFAPFYDAVLLAFPMPSLRREVVRLADVPHGSRVLDVATGTGAQAFAFAPTAKEVVGIDLSEAMLRIARRKNRFSNVTFKEANATSLPFEDHSFDAACISFALHEMPNSIRKRVVREMARVTRPSGRIVIVDYALPHGRVARAIAYKTVKLYERDHYASFVKLDLEALLRRAGIVFEERHPVIGGLAAVVMARRAGQAEGA